MDTRESRQAKSDGWNNVKRIMAFGAAIALWITSMVFSYNGFNFSMEGMAWMGIIMSLAITIVELVFNSDISKLNLTLFFLGAVAYLYGTWTNVVGIFIAQGNTWDGFLKAPYIIAFPIVFGLFIEVAPEALFVLAIGAADSGDFLGNLFRGRKKIQRDDWTRVESRVTTEKKHTDVPGKNNSGEGRRVDPAIMTKLPQRHVEPPRRVFGGD